MVFAPILQGWSRVLALYLFILVRCVMSIGEILANVRAFLDTMGLTPFLYAFLIIASAFFVLSRFRES